jgi:hypothetical protein
MMQQDGNGESCFRYELENLKASDTLDVGKILTLGVAGSRDMNPFYEA